MKSVKQIVELSLASIQNSQRNFMCVAIKQHCEDDEALEQKCVKIMEKYKPKGKNNPYIGWWSFYDRKSRIEALEKAIGELK